MNIVKKLKNNPEKMVYGIEKLGLLDWMADEQYIRLVYRLAFGRKIDLENPKALTEKLNWYKLHYRNPIMKKCVDKYAVREFVKEKLGNETPYLNDCYGVWDHFDEIDFSSLPNEFVLKTTNGSGDVVICEDKDKFDFASAKKKLSENEKRSFVGRAREWAYYDVPYRIIAERLIHSSDKNQIKDYKFFCFDGEPAFLFVASERGTDNLKFDFFDLDWNWLPVTNEHEHNPCIPKPEHFDEMLDISRKLSEPFPHVRVDLYEEEGQVFFGELTFYHFGGFAKFRPDEWDYKFGMYFDLQMDNS